MTILPCMSRAALLLAALAAAPAALAQTTAVTFDNGAEGWIGPTGPGGTTSVVSTGGNPGANMRTVFNNFGITFANSTNAAFTGDFTNADSVTIAIDVRVENLAFFGSQVTRNLVLELRDTTNPPAGYPWQSAWVVLSPISLAATGSWKTFSATFDPNSTALPAGWGGYGAEDPVTFEPELPAGTTFRDIVSDIDTMAFTTLQPGFFYGFTDFTVRIDNIRVTRTTARPEDLNGDNRVDAADVAALLVAWGPCPAKGACAADLDADGLVGAPDLAAVLLAWGL
jgi:hypothetical protein